MTPVFFVAFLAALGGLFAFAGLITRATLDLVQAVWRRRVSSALNALVALLGAVALFFVARFAAVLAERRNHWVDRDDNGIQDDFVNGSYDWFDVNVETWGAYAAIGLVIVVSGVMAARAAIRTSCSRWLTFRG